LPIIYFTFKFAFQSITNQIMKIRILLLVSFIALLQSCNSETIKANKNISEKLRETIKSKNDSLLVAMQTSNLKIYKTLGTEKFIKHLQAETRNVVWLYREGYLNNEYTIYDEYEIKLPKAFKYIEIPSEEKKYTFKYLSEEKETYVSLLKTSLYQNDYLLAVVYNLTDKGWKINDIEVSMFGHLNKTAKEYYDMAKKADEKGMLIDAFQYANVAVVSIDQAESMLKFDEEKSIKLYRDKLNGKLENKYKFPAPIEDIRSQPEVTAVEYALTKEGLFPQITYRTTIPLKDSTRVVDEFNFVKVRVKDMYPDMDFNRKILYNVENVTSSRRGSDYKDTMQLIDDKKK